MASDPNKVNVTSDHVRPVVTSGVIEASEFNEANCTIVAIVSKYSLDHLKDALATLENGDVVLIVPGVYLIANQKNGKQDPTKFPDIRGAQSRSDVTKAFRAVGVEPYGGI